MNIKLTYKILGSLLFLESVFMIMCLGVSLIYQEDDTFAFILSILITQMFGFAFRYLGREASNTMSRRDSFLVVTLAWTLFSLFGTLPFLIGGYITNFTNAFFESMSGFTTTGATILTKIESVPKDILLWRSMTQWIGGLAIIVFSLAILPYLGMSGMQLFVSEINGITYDKLHPRVMHTVRRIWFIYLFFTLLETLLLYWGDMGLYDALCHSLTTISSGGFSTRTANIGAFSNYSQVVITVFMLLSGCNFSLLLLSLSWRSFTILKNQEFRTFLLYTVFLGIGIGLVLLFGCHKSFGASFRESFFSVISTFTTTGFFVSDYTAWPTFLWIILFLLMFIGGCSGSTSGGVKIFRHLIFVKNSILELKRIIHPNAVLPVKVNGKAISTSGVYKHITFIFVYFLFFLLGAIILLAQGIDIETALGASIATLSNVGTGLGQVGPGGSYVFFPIVTKWLLMLFMLLGRVELFSLITLLSRSFWRN